MNKPLLTLQDCERKFDEKFPDMYGVLPNYIDPIHVENKGKPVHSDEIKLHIRESFIQLLQSQIEEWKGMMHPRVKTVNYCEVCDVSDPNCDTNRILQSLINSNEEVISKIHGK